MSWDTVVCKVIDLFSSNRFKYDNSHKNIRLFNDIYEPIFCELRPFFRNYNEDKDGEKIISTLEKCRNQLLKNNSLVNPAYSKYIEKIITDENTFYDKFSTSKSKEKNHKKNEKWRKDQFFWFIHEFIKDYNELRKALGKPKLNHNQINMIDEIAYDNNKYLIITLIFIFAILIIPIAILMSLYSLIELGLKIYSDWTNLLH